MENMRKENKWVKDFKELLVKRDNLVKTITKEISDLKYYRAIVIETINKINEIHERHRRAIRDVELYGFQSSINVLGRDNFDKIVRKICSEIDMYTYESLQDREQKNNFNMYNDIDNSYSFDDGHDPEDSDDMSIFDYYCPWED